MKTMKREAGFTIYEAALALAVSGSLIVIAAGIYTMAANQRYTDSINGTKAFIEQQYNDVTSGINSRMGGDDQTAVAKAQLDKIGCGPDAADTSLVPVSETTPGGYGTGNSKCYLLGKLLQFGNQEMTTKYIVAATQNVSVEWPKESESSIENIINISNNASIGNLYLIDGTATDQGSKLQSRQYGDDNELHGVWLAPNDGSASSKGVSGNYNNVAIVHSPKDDSVIAIPNVKVAANSNGSIVQIQSTVDEVANNRGLVVSLRRGGMSISGRIGSAAICIPLNASSSGVQSVAPAPNDSDAAGFTDVCNGDN